MFAALSPQPADPLLALIGLFQADQRPDKIDLGVGVYRDDEGKTPVFRAIKLAERMLWDTQQTKSYIGPEGDSVLLERLWALVGGDAAQAVAGECCPRPKQICDHPNNEPDKISHPATASPDSRSTASQIEFATGTGAIRLVRMIGASQAAALLENGELLSSIAAHNAGLVDELVPAEELLVSARRWVQLSAAQRMQHPVQAAIKAMLAEDHGVPMDAGLRAAATRFVEVPALPHEQRSLVLPPDVSMVSFDPEGREDYPA
jgi:Enoyl-CoA hydratase/isomerase